MCVYIYIYMYTVICTGRHPPATALPPQATTDSGKNKTEKH